MTLWRVGPGLIEARRRAMQDDVWLFHKWIWAPQEAVKQGRDMAVERFHRPLMYVFDGDADRLAWCLDHYESAVVDEIRRDCLRNEIDWRTSKGVRQLRRRLRKVNNRMSRWFMKTTAALCSLLKIATFNPDESIAIASKSDKSAWGFCSTIGNVMRSKEYALYFSDRLHRRSNGSFDYSTHITQEWIRIAGRRNPNQETIEARGLRAQWPGNHYSLILGDDLSGTETGDASVDQALSFLANIDAISMPPEFPRPTRQLINGTKQGGRDDFAVLCSDPEFLSLRVPIWKKSVPTSYANVKKDGVPTLPEFAGLENIRRMRASAETNPKLGLIWFMRNYELSDEVGALHFTEDLLRRQKFQWITRITRNRSNGQMRKVRMIRRYRWNEDGSPRTREKPYEHRCECYLDCGLLNHAYIEWDPLALPRVLGVDQAVAIRGDPWAVGCVCRDPEGCLYSLRGESGTGYDSMIPSIPLVFDRWGGLKNPPRAVGIESNSWQAITVNWLQRGDIFSDLSRRVVPVPAGTTSKAIRMYNAILSPMLMGTFLIDPDDKPLHDEMLKWDGTKSNPTDGMLDALGIAAVTHTIPAYDPKADYTELMRAERDYRNDVDPVTGIDMSSDILDAAWNFGDLFDPRASDDDYDFLMSGG